MVNYQIKNKKHLFLKALKVSVKCVFFPRGNKIFAVGNKHLFPKEIKKLIKCLFPKGVKKFAVEKNNKPIC